jgi:hypothetical protein
VLWKIGGREETTVGADAAAQTATATVASNKLAITQSANGQNQPVKRLLWLGEPEICLADMLTG